MTTVCADLANGVVISDTCVTTSNNRGLWIKDKWFIPLVFKKDTFSTCTQKALYIEDGVFCGSGDVDNISKIANQFLGLKEDINSDSTTACYIRKNYYVIWDNRSGELKKKVFFYNKEDGIRLYFGSGGKWIKKLLKGKPCDVWDVILKFKFIKQLDVHTNDRINIHYI